jgi:hypothetical protein
LGPKHPGPHAAALQTVAEDLAVLNEQFAAEAASPGRSSYQARARVFGEPCEVTPRGSVRWRPRRWTSRARVPGVAESLR